MAKGRPDVLVHQTIACTYTYTLAGSRDSGGWWVVDGVPCRPHSEVERFAVDIKRALQVGACVNGVARLANQRRRPAHVHSIARVPLGLDSRYDVLHVRSPLVQAIHLAFELHAAGRVKRPRP
eukprot:6160199-Prymnesium_polylepis.2